MSFPPGYSDLLPDEVAVLNALVKRLKDDKSLENEGKGDRAVADLKQAGEKVKDAFKK